MERTDPEPGRGEAEALPHQGGGYGAAGDSAGGAKPMLPVAPREGKWEGRDAPPAERDIAGDKWLQGGSPGSSAQSAQGHGRPPGRRPPPLERAGDSESGTPVLGKLGGSPMPSTITTVVAQVCLLLFLAMLSVRLSSSSSYIWPVYMNFLPLWGLSAVIYFLVGDFAATTLSDQRKIVRQAILFLGLLTALVYLTLSSLFCLKLADVIHWSWTTLLLPLWPLLATLQLLLFVLIPGVLEMKMEKELFAAFCLIWGLPCTALLACLKLDDQFDAMRWVVTMIPALVALAVAGLAARSPEEVANPVVVLLSLVMLSLKLDDVLAIPWAVVFLPVVLVLLVSLAQGCLAAFGARSSPRT